MRTCEYLEGCYAETGNMKCWFCTAPICPNHSNRIQVWCESWRGWAMRRRRVCDDCLNGEVRP